jgi:hypothetical protein
MIKLVVSDAMKASCDTPVLCLLVAPKSPSLWAACRFFRRERALDTGGSPR